MKTIKVMMALGLGLAVSACGVMPDIPSRNAPFETTAGQRTLAPEVQNQVLGTQLPASMSVAQINVDVPYELTISEGNGYYPKADIVWRGDPQGDRRQQITEIFTNAFGYGTRGMTGDTPITLDVEVVRFHSVTDRTRLSVGGVHNMIFNLTIRDARTGQKLVPTREVMADLKAYGGVTAVKAEQRGQTQKVRVTGYLARVIQQELGQPISG